MGNSAFPIETRYERGLVYLFVVEGKEKELRAINCFDEEADLFRLHRPERGKN